MNFNKSILCVGETIIDLIGTQLDESLYNNSNYQRHLGGSPTNVAVNLSSMGFQSHLISTVGDDGLGDFALSSLKMKGVNTKGIRKDHSNPTSVILVSKSTQTPEFIPFRKADKFIHMNQITTDILQSCHLFHTTCFALSENPARETILKFAKLAKSMNLILSIDLNYSNKIWANNTDALLTITEFLNLQPIVKVSDDDCYRLFEAKNSDDMIFSFFHERGAEMVCLTKGKKGVVLSQKSSALVITKKALTIDEIKDATGAGDAFWSGFIAGILNNKSMDECIDFGQKIASIKLQNVGGLPDDIKLLI